MADYREYKFDPDEYNKALMRGVYDEPSPPPVAAIPEKPSAWRRVPDVGVTALKGAVGLAEAGIGLADIPTFGAVGRSLEKVGVRPGKAQEELSSWYSPQQKEAQREVSGAFEEGFFPGVSAAIRNPSTIATTIGESVPTMLGGAGVARGILKFAPKVAPWVAGALGEGVVGAGSAAEQIRQQSETGYLTPKQALSTVGSGAGTAAFGAVGGKFAQKFDVGDVETALARGAVGKSNKGFVRRLVESGFSEGVIEELPQSVQEQMWQNYALDRPLTEGLAESAGMGMLAGVGMGATVGALTRKRDLTKPAAEQDQEAPPPPGAPAPGTATDMFTGQPREVADPYEAAMQDAVGTARQLETPLGQGDLFEAPRPPVVKPPAAPAWSLEAPEQEAARLAVSKGVRSVSIPELRSIGIKTKRQMNELLSKKLGKAEDYATLVEAINDRLAEKTEGITSKQEDAALSLLYKLEHMKKLYDEKVAQSAARRGVDVGTKTGFGEMAQMERLLAEDRAAHEAAQDTTRGYQEARLAEIGETLESAAKQRNAQKRLTALVAVLNAPFVKNKEQAFVAALRRAKQPTKLTPEEQAVIQRHADVVSAYKVEQFGQGDLLTGAFEPAPVAAPEGVEPEPADFAGREFRGQGKLLTAAGRAKTQAEMQKGDRDAVQERSAEEEVPRPGKPGQAVVEGGEGVRPLIEGKETAPEGKAEKVDLKKAGAKITTSAVGVSELATELDAVQGELSMADLTKEERSELRKKEAEIKRKALALGTKLSETAGVENPISVESLTSRLKAMFRAAPLFDKIMTIYATQAEAVSKGALSETDGFVMGFKTADGKVGLIAENIEDGRELGVFLHEVGVHLGMKRLVGAKNFDWLRERVADWAKRNDGSEESKAAKAAIRRALKSTSTNKDEEVVAYMVEELTNRGIKPRAVAKGTLAEWLGKFVNWTRIALFKMGMNAKTSFSGQNLVDLAYGAASLELTGKQGATITYQNKEAFEAAERHVKEDYETLSVETLSGGKVSATRVPRGIQFSEVSTGAEPVLNNALAAMRSRKESGSSATRIAAMVPFTQDLVSWAKDYMPSAVHYWDAVNDMMAEVKRWSVETHKALQIFAMMAKPSQNKVQRFLFDGKMSGMWGKQFSWVKDADGAVRQVPVSPEMEAKWNALTKEEQASAEKTLHLMYDLRIEHVKAVEENVKTMRKYAGTLKTESQKDAMLKDINDEMTKLSMWANYSGPYVPTMRFGQWMVVAKSKAYLSADAAKQAKMESDGSHYQFWKFKTEHEAMKKKAEIADKFADGTLDALPTLDTPKGRKEDFAALLRLETKVREQKEDASPESVAEMLSMLRDITRELSDEYSEAQSRQQFKAVTGAKWEEVMLGVKIRGDQLAFTIGRLKHNRKVATSMYDMRKEIDDSGDRTTATHLWNELNARYEGGLGESSPDTAVKAILGAVSFWKLLTNPMYFAVQYLQNPQYGIPSMMRQGFGYTESWGAWMSNLKVVNEVWTQGKVFKGIVEDMSWVGDQKKIEFLEWLRNRNLLDMGMESDTGAFDGSHPVTQAAERTLMLFRNAVQNTEIINRVSVALAVYDMGKKKGMTDKQIRDAAETVITDAHGLYAGFASPRYLSTKGFMRIPMQFRRFQLIQAGFLYKNLVLEAKKLKNPAERGAALRVMAATLGHTLAVSGLKGSVLWLVVSGLVTLAGAGDDDEDVRDADTKATEWLGENYSPEFAEFIMRGAPTAVGMNISARASQNPLTILPFDNQTIFEAMGSKKKLQENAYTLVGGAAGAVLSDIIDGFDLVSQGEYYKGTEMMMPSLARGLMRTGRFTTEGVTKRNGDVTMTPDELSMWELVQQGVGTAPAKVQKAYWVQEKLRGVQEEFAAQAKQMKHDYIEAFEGKDAGAKAELRKKWVGMALAMRKVGLKPPPLSTLFRAPLEKRKRERQVVEGVSTTKATRRFVEELT